MVFVLFSCDVLSNSINLTLLCAVTYVLLHNRSQETIHDSVERILSQLYDPKSYIPVVPPSATSSNPHTRSHSAYHSDPRSR